MSIRMLRGLVIAVLGVALVGCGTSAEEAQLSVNGRPLSVALYHSIVATEQHKFERTGAQVNWHSVSGQRRLANIESAGVPGFGPSCKAEEPATPTGDGCTARGNAQQAAPGL